MTIDDPGRKDKKPSVSEGGANEISTVKGRS
jgi:hypothetical protein